LSDHPFILRTKEMYTGEVIK